MLDADEHEVCFECCITSQDRAGRLLWDSLSKNCLTACTTNKSSHLEVSHSSEVPVLPAIPSDFCEHFLRMGECEGLQGSCQLFHSPCFCFSLSQYPTFIGFYCGNHVQWGQDDALSLGRLLFPRCQCGLEAERPAWATAPSGMKFLRHALTGLKFSGQRVRMLLSHMRFSSFVLVHLDGDGDPRGCRHICDWSGILVLWLSGYGW